MHTSMIVAQEQCLTAPAQCGVVDSGVNMCSQRTDRRCPGDYVRGGLCPGVNVRFPITST